MNITQIIVAIFLFVILLLAGAYIAIATRWNLKDRYDEELEQLDRQLRDKLISEETYKELKRNLERKYKHYT